MKEHWFDWWGVYVCLFFALINVACIVFLEPKLWQLNAVSGIICVACAAKCYSSTVRYRR